MLEGHQTGLGHEGCQVVFKNMLDRACSCLTVIEEYCSFNHNTFGMSKNVLPIIAHLVHYSHREEY